MAAAGQNEELRSMPPKVDRIEVYESATLLVLLGRKRASGAWRVLRFNRSRAEGETLPAVEEAEEYDAAGAHARIAALSTRETPLTYSFGAVALLGAVRFLEGYYLLFVTRLEPVGIIAGHSVFRVEDTAMVSIKAGGFSSAARARPSPCVGGAAASAPPSKAGVAMPPPTPPPERGSVRGGEDRGAAWGWGAAGGGAGVTPRAVPPSVSTCASHGPACADAGVASAGSPAGGEAAEGGGGCGSGGGGFGRVLHETAASVLAGIKLGSRHLSGRWGERWDDGWAERRYRSLFLAMDLTRDFYFSYTYELSLTLQENMSCGDQPAGGGSAPRAAGVPPVSGAPPMRDKFVWSHHLMLPLLPHLKDGAWLTPLLHGFFRQVCLSLCGRPVSLTLIARRSRLFAGARLLKRGLCAAGHVANEVETEQVMADGSRGGLHAGHLSSFVQLRGSIPLVWGHGDEGRHIVPRPDIHLQRIDPTFTFTRRHFEELWQRCAASHQGPNYGAPLVLFDLVRQTERRPRETLVGKGLAEAIASLQASLSREGHPMRASGLRYVPFDFKKESKRKGGDVLATVEAIAAHMIRRVGFYSSAPPDTLAPPPAARRATLPDRPLPSAAPTAPALGTRSAECGLGAAGEAAAGGLRGEVRLCEAPGGMPGRPTGVGGASLVAGCGGVRLAGSGGERSGMADPAASLRSSAASSCLSMDSPRPRTPAPLARRLLDPPPAAPSPPACSPASRRDSGGCVSPDTSAASSCASFAGLASSRLHAQLVPAHGAAPVPRFCADLSDDDSCHPTRRTPDALPNAAGNGAGGASPRPVQSGVATPGCAEAVHRFRQRGVIRTNCIDCLDRTNVAQFCIGRCVLKQQLVALGVISHGKAYQPHRAHAPPPPPAPDIGAAGCGRSRLLRRAVSSAAVLGGQAAGMGGQKAQRPASCEPARREQGPERPGGCPAAACRPAPLDGEGRQGAVPGGDGRGDGREGVELASSLLVSMYEEMGTGLALQYAGSQALHATNSNAAKDLIQSVKRFYRNTFTDVEKQHIIDVFLGVFIPARGTPHIWELESDAYLHNQPPPTLYAPLRMPAAPRAPTTIPPPPPGIASPAAYPAAAALPPAAPPVTAAHQAAARHTAPPHAGREHPLFNDMYGPSTLASFDELLARPFVHPFSPPVLRRPAVVSPRQPPPFTRAASVSLPCAPTSAAPGALGIPAKPSGGGCTALGTGSCGGTGRCAGGASLDAPEPLRGGSVSSSSSEDEARLISPREMDHLAESSRGVVSSWASPSPPRANLGGASGGGAARAVGGGLASGGGSRHAVGAGGQGGGCSGGQGGGQGGGYGGGYGFGSAEGAACLASLAAVDDALGGGGGQWGAAGYSKEAMRHATLGEDAQVLLPLGYVAVDEWDRRRRADRIDPAAAYAHLGRPHTDVACYQRYCDATGGGTAGVAAGGAGLARGLGCKEEHEGV